MIYFVETSGPVEVYVVPRDYVAPVSHGPVISVPDHASAVLQLLYRGGFHAVLHSVLEAAGLTDHELGKVMQTCERLQVRQYQQCAAVPAVAPGVDDEDLEDTVLYTDALEGE